MVADGYISCATDNAEQLWCWGNLSQYQLGEDSNVPVNITHVVNKSESNVNNDKIVKLVFDYNTMCALLDTGKGKCWGDIAPYHEGLTNIEDIAMGFDHNCIIKKEHSTPEIKRFQMTQLEAVYNQK